MKLTNFFQIFPLKVDLVGKKVSGFAIAMTAKLGALFLVEDLPDSLKVCSLNCRTSFGGDVMTAFNVTLHVYVIQRIAVAYSKKKNELRVLSIGFGPTTFRSVFQTLYY